MKDYNPQGASRRKGLRSAAQKAIKEGTKIETGKDGKRFVRVKFQNAWRIWHLD
jgi:hypothetical protein